MQLKWIRSEIAPPVASCWAPEMTMPSSRSLTTPIERGIALLVRGLAAVDLRRHDRVGGVEVIVTQVLVEGDDIVTKMLACGREYARQCGVAAEETGDVVRRAPHQAERRLCPNLGEQAPRP